MKTAGVAAAVLTVFLAGGRTASAATTVRLELFPSQPRAGQLATIQLRTFWLLEGTPPAVLPADTVWKIAGIGPRSRRLSIRISRDLDDPFLWAGRVRFPSSGRWTVCVVAPGGCPYLLGQRITVPVRRRKSRIDPWQRLERPLRIASIPAGANCPTTGPDSKGDLSRIGFAGTAWGEGPAYPVLGSGEKPLLSYIDPLSPQSGFDGSPWSGQKVLWAVDAIFSGPILVRGRELDGPNELRFDRGTLPPRQMQIRPGAAPRGRPSYTRVRAPGCYGYQVDAPAFSYVIVFEARRFD